MIHGLFDYCDRVAGEFKRSFVDLPYLHNVCGVIEQCVAGRLPEGKKNVAVALPPRHYKTTFISQGTPAWCWAEVSPDCEFILTSATAGLATSNAMAVKDIVRAEWHQRQYPRVRVDSDQKDTQNHFKTTAGGEIYATGLGGQITGFGAGKVRRGFGGAIIIDDPLKADDASSKTLRAHSIDYYLGTLKSRRNNVHNTPFILVAQRLHPDDLIGWVMTNEPNDWHLVTFPARYDGALLNPITMSHEELDLLEAVAPSVYFAQYQQSPIIEGGNIIKMDWWHFFDQSAHRSTGLIFLTADTGFKDKASNDASVIRVWEATPTDLYCHDAVYGRWEFPRLIAEARAMWEKWSAKGAQRFYIEDKASGITLVQMLQEEGIAGAEGWAPKDFDFPDDKVGRIKACAFEVFGGHIWLPEGPEKIEIADDQTAYGAMHSKVLIEEAAAFAADDSHAHDDHCDTFTMAVSIWRYYR